ncbi:MAG TPA: hypothetical protein VHE37_11045 [Nevskiaceae bacterium]|nr:hypothetical protein [Nevskiaceae bacterium]
MMRGMANRGMMLAGMLFVAMPAFSQSVPVANTANMAAAMANFSTSSAAPALQVPGGGGSGWGSIGVGVYGQTARGTPARADGSLGLNFGLFDPAKYFGLDLSVSFTSLTGANGSRAFDAGTLGYKLHTNLPGLVSFGIGATSVQRWGVAKANKADEYASLSKYFPMGAYALSATVGVGDGGFTTDGKGVAGYGSLAFYLTPRISFIGEFTGRFTNFAVSWAPLRLHPLSVTLGAVNLTQWHGLDTQVAASVGYGFGF